MVRSEEFDHEQHYAQENYYRQEAHNHGQYHQEENNGELAQTQRNSNEIFDALGSVNDAMFLENGRAAATMWNSTNNNSTNESSNQSHRKLKILMVHQGLNSGKNIVQQEGSLSSASSATTSSSDGGNGILLSPSAGTGGNNTLDDKRLRRQIANCNERRRMQSINAGFQTLRQLLPSKEGEKMSKAAILQQTADFIHALQEEKDRLMEENEIFAKIKRRRLDDMSIQNEEQMDTSEENKPSQTTQLGQKVTEPPMDVLECLKTIDELRRELLREQQLRKVFQQEVVEMKNKTVTLPNTNANIVNTVFNTGPTTSPMNSGLTTSCHTPTDAYSQIILSVQPPPPPKISPLSTRGGTSAFSAFSSLQDALNSPLLSTALSGAVTSPVPHNNAFPEAGCVLSSTNAAYVQPMVIQNVAAAAPVTRTDIINVPETGHSTITLTLPSDMINQLGQNVVTNNQQTPHIVLDMANSNGDQFIAIKQQHDATTSVQAKNSALNLCGISQTLPQQFASGNLLIQVNQATNSALNSLGVYAEQDVGSKMVHEPPIVYYSNSAPTIGATTSTTQAHDIASPSANAATSASISQRNLQAILDAIRHIEGGTLAANINTTTASSSPCSQASDLLVR